MGVCSVPVQLGINGAAWNACLMMIVLQYLVVGFLYWHGSSFHALAILVLIIVQLLIMKYFLGDPVKRSLFLGGFGAQLFVSGMMISVFAGGSIG